MSVVLDTNVLIAANGGAGQAGLSCVENCIDALVAARDDLVLVDDGYRIFEQYRTYCSHAGQPGAGDAFFKWLWDNQAQDASCRQIRVTPDRVKGFAEFPDDSELTAFDRSDRVFVAVALASELSPEILNATDNDWWQARKALERNGVNVRFLCPELMT